MHAIRAGLGISRTRITRTPPTGIRLCRRPVPGPIALLVITGIPGRRPEQDGSGEPALP